MTQNPIFGVVGLSMLRANPYLPLALISWTSPFSKVNAGAVLAYRKPTSVWRLFSVDSSHHCNLHMKPMDGRSKPFCGENKVDKPPGFCSQMPKTSGMFDSDSQNDQFLGF